MRWLSMRLKKPHTPMPNFCDGFQDIWELTVSIFSRSGSSSPRSWRAKGVR